MKVIYYLNNSVINNIVPVALSAWSVKTNGNLPADTEYILYTDAEENFEDELLNKVFTSIQAPPFDKTWFEALDWEHIPAGIKYLPSDQVTEEERVKGTRKITWAKLVSFLKTPCEGEPVIYLDYDVLCLGDISGIIPSDDKTWACYKPGENTFNNGVLVKTPAFDEASGSDCMLEPLSDLEKYNQAYAIAHHGDEIGTIWYSLSRGTEDLYELPKAYNFIIQYADPFNKNFSFSEARLVHYIYLSKPWKLHTNLAAPIIREWWNQLDNMFQSLELSTKYNL